MFKLKLYLLTGQMMFFSEWDVMLYLCSPILNSIDALTDAGLFINDLAMHDFSRDLLLAGTAHNDCHISFLYNNDDGNDKSIPSYLIGH